MKKRATFALLSAIIATSAVAKDSKQINKTMDIAQGQKIALDAGVGTLTIETCQCNEIELQISIEEQDGWSLFGSTDVDSVELKIKERNNRISFIIDDDDIKQKWKVTLPASSALAIELGVGEVEINNFSNDLTAEVGVGSIDVELNSDNYRDIELGSGVGETSVSGLKGQVKSKRAVVSSSTRYHGEGEHSISIEVGVGEASVGG